MRTVFRTAESHALFGTAAVRRQVRRGEWRRPATGVVVTHNGEVSRREKQEVLLCISPPASALGGLTSLERDRFKGFDQQQVKGPEGRYFLDASWDDWGVTVEVHGVGHLEAEQSAGRNLMRHDHIPVLMHQVPSAPTV